MMSLERLTSASSLPRGDAGQTLTEYALILGFCSILAALALSDIGAGVIRLLTTVARGI